MRKGRVWRGDVSTRMPVLNMDMLLADIAGNCSCCSTRRVTSRQWVNTGRGGKVKDKLKTAAAEAENIKRNIKETLHLF